MYSVSEVMDSRNVAVIGASRDPLKLGVLRMVGIDELIGTLISRDGRSGLCQHVAICQKGEEGRMKGVWSYMALAPPSTIIVCPVIKSEASEQRNNAGCATSIGSAILPRGMALTI